MEEPKLNNTFEQSMNLKYLIFIISLFLDYIYIEALCNSSSNFNLNIFGVFV